LVRVEEKLSGKERNIQWRKEEKRNVTESGITRRKEGERTGKGSLIHGLETDQGLRAKRGLKIVNTTRKK